MPQPQPPASQTVVFRGARFDVVKKAWPSREGGGMEREVVVPSNAVVILPVLDATPGRERIVFIRNERPAIGETLWELPAGTIEEGEDPGVCAERELVEETGYEAERVTKLVDFHSSPGFCTELLTAYVGEGLTHVGQDLDDTEKIDVEPMALEDGLRLVRENRVRDAKSIATLLYWMTFLRGNG